ncbi:putative RNA-binding protein 3 [Monocercomonoides exilis]|uniref:putative RNA-binding protein 3 n=1 Tax=Monocercomonoides exilis TaxID=2049356 RepID=UPI00355A977A|nr:putative RNA-binding protein 3 [Monocercomonoides exilis]|eukprot:MONOS_10442.1-p1 / transcript=MONOS_10442.1 / gene=MONOS_10442 / organism=Monocercomonoides_exilis_PA203 / gene_product=unspecified product / transcript_product=unspecified product / location=Mono_scaffold00475:36006-37532(+) / protein_length=508 / sequence_SO=supercontig / SO=protein_coding / is_pseudo=false
MSSPQYQSHYSPNMQHSYRQKPGVQGASGYPVSFYPQQTMPMRSMYGHSISHQSKHSSSHEEVDQTENYRDVKSRSPSESPKRNERSSKHHRSHKKHSSSRSKRSTSKKHHHKHNHSKSVSSHSSDSQSKRRHRSSSTKKVSKSHSHHHHSTKHHNHKSRSSSRDYDDRFDYFHGHHFLPPPMMMPFPAPRRGAFIPIPPTFRPIPMIRFPPMMPYEKGMRSEYHRKSRYDTRDEHSRGDIRSIESTSGKVFRAPPSKSSRFTLEQIATSTYLFVGNLPYTTRESDLKKLFESNTSGVVKEVVINVDNQTKMSRGTAFVTFDTHEHAEEAMRKMHGYELDGRPIRIDWDIGKDEKDKMRDQHGPRRGRERSGFSENDSWGIDPYGKASETSDSWGQSAETGTSWNTGDVGADANVQDSSSWGESKDELSARKRSQSPALRSNHTRDDSESRSRSNSRASSRHLSRSQSRSKSRSRSRSQSRSQSPSQDTISPVGKQYLLDDEANEKTN